MLRLKRRHLLSILQQDLDLVLKSLTALKLGHLLLLFAVVDIDLLADTESSILIET